MSWLREAGAEPLPGYSLVEPLGTGGFGEVWKCVAPGGINKAIKFVYGNLNSLDGDAIKAEQELKALERVKEVRHPFVVSMDRIEVVSGELVIVMELADKSLHDLADEYRQSGRPGIPRDELLSYLRDAADGLDHLIDKHNLQHLDVKPRNLFLLADRVKVADFGLVKHLERSSSSGLMGGVSPLYAAPETFSGKVSKHSDQYSLAVVYMELLANLRPFKGRNIRQLAMQHMQEPPDLSGLPASDRGPVARALAKVPEQRYPNCLAFIRSLVSGSDRPASSSRSFSSMSLAELQLEKLGPNEEAAPDGLMATSLPAEAVRAALANEENQLAVTSAEVDLGVFRPTLFIGIGGFGRRALLELRCRLLDLFGDLNQVPAMRYLYLDGDPEADRKASSGPADIALSTTELFPLTLQPVGNYRRRMLEFLADWMPREKLFGIPRSLHYQGSRALGRLAFCDHFLRLQARLKREFQIITHPEALSQSLSQTGLSLRSTSPRVFVFGSAAGGSSGFIADLGYALRRTLTAQHFTGSPVTAILQCGAPDDPATPPLERANLYATLTELNHFNDPAVSFSAQYGPDSPRLADESRPFSSIYLLPLVQRTPDSLQTCVAHVASYVSHDVATLLGSRLDQTRAAPPSNELTPFRSFGTNGIWFPRGLLLRVAARQCCQLMIQHWQAPGAVTAPAAVETVIQQATAHPDLRWETLAVQLDRAAAGTPEGQPSVVLQQLLSDLEQQLSVLPSAEVAGWANQAMTAVKDLVGGRSVHSSESLYRKSRSHRALTHASATVAEQWENHFTATVLPLMDYPGRRIATTEAAFQRLVRFSEQAAEEQRRRLDQQTNRSRDAFAAATSALEACRPGSFSLFGLGLRSARGVFDALAHFAKERLHEEFLHAGVQFWRHLQGRVEERLRDLAFCRQRLRHLQPLLAGVFQVPETTTGNVRADWAMSPVSMPDPIHQAMQGSPTLRVVLPEGESDLEEAAAHLVRGMLDTDWLKLEELLQGLVLSPLGGLLSVCQRGGDLLRHLAGPLIDQTAAYMGSRVPSMDVAQVEFSTVNRGKDVAEEVTICFEAARPLLPARSDSGQKTYLLVPGSETGEAFAQMAVEQIVEMKVVPNIGQTTLTICREQGYLPAADVHQILQSCKDDYDKTASVPATSPHARFDVYEWIPLEP